MEQQCREQEDLFGEVTVGLTTVDALRLLNDELQCQLQLYLTEVSAQSWMHWLRKSFLHHRDVSSTFHWTSAGIILLSSCLLFLAYGAKEPRETWLVVEGLLLLVFLTLTLYLMAWDYKLKTCEVSDKAARVLLKLKACVREGIWSTENFLSLHCPLSPCVTMQWTVRDGCVVNLPCAFLVEGDVVYLRPGQVIPANCRSIVQEYDEEFEDQKVYKEGDLFHPVLADGDMCGTPQPQARRPIKARPYLITHTPFVENLRLMLRDVNSRPNSLLNNERYQIYNVFIERRFLPFVLIVSLLTNVLRYLFLNDDVGHWVEMFIVQQVHVVLPLTVLTFPIVWCLLQMYGTAKVISAFNHAKLQKPKPMSKSFDSDSDSSLNDTLNETANLPLHRKVIWGHLKDILLGQSNCLPRTANALHALGNVTSYCCVDKKGVLSWPNPTAEKVFFLNNGQQETSKHSSKCSAPSQESHMNTSHASVDSIETEPHVQVLETAPLITSMPSSMPKSQLTDSKHSQYTAATDTDFVGETTIQVLDLTQDTKNHYGLQFDDPGWKKYVNSLKPLGLNILLNTCNLDTTHKYTQFADHVSCAALKREETVPVMNRSESHCVTIEALSTVRKRCFCEIARQIGFADHAVQIFDTQQLLAMYRHVVPEATTRDKLSRSKSFIKYKMPMPNMFSVVSKENTSGMLQMFSQGTADLLLDACSDFWDGDDLCALQESDRKKIADFYHRTSMSSYCTAFSYRPITQLIGSEFSEFYIEVPEDAHDLYPALRSPTPTKPWDTQSLETRLREVRDCYHGSADSLITGTSSTSVHDVESCFRAQCNQIFIGMITMQYQAKQDIVDLIEDLESACIRFVHFSKENELRSRVFSEKMGLEAGWNCHISLLGQQPHIARGSTGAAGDDPSASHLDLSHSGSSHHVSRYSSRLSTDSMPLQRVSKDSLPPIVKPSQDSVRGRRCSAPGAISLDTSQVKFETTPSPCKTMKTRTRGMSGMSSAASDTSVDMVEPTQPLLHSDHSCYNSDMDCSGKDKENAVFDDDQVSEDSLPASSYVTENTDSVTGGLVLSNRAKLPKGIENIRPHIETVDDVPLLVNLFTDCTPDTTREMLRILQEYGDVVCCLGSSANIHNTPLFLQADCSLSVEPLYPQICMKQAVVVDPVWGSTEFPSPMELSALLHNIPCSLSFNRDDSIRFIQLIALARHFCQRLRNTFLMLLMCQLSVTLLQLLAAFFLLPPILSPHLLLWLVTMVTPILSLSMMGNSLDLQIVKMAQGKNLHHISRTAQLQFVGYFVFRYVPSLLVCLLTHGLTLHSFCLSKVAPPTVNRTTEPCHPLHGYSSHPEGGEWNGWSGSYVAGLTLSQNIVAFQLVLYFVCCSLCFIHRLKHLWQKSPFTNKYWCIVAPCLLAVQVAYFATDLTATNSVAPVIFSLWDVPMETWVVALGWPLLLVPLHELAKRMESKQWVRSQKRARLDFGTKLGMNSPF